jgi:hypothetical protein
MSDFGEAAEIVNELALEMGQMDEKSPQDMKWHRQVALSTLLMALITAVGALLAGMTAHEALLDRTEELIAITIDENDRVRVEVLEAKMEIMAALGEAPNPADLAQIQIYQAEIEAMEEEAAQVEARVRAINTPHLILAISVTLLSVGIALSGMSIIVAQKSLWFAGLIVGVVGGIGVGLGIFALI